MKRIILRFLLTLVFILSVNERIWSSDDNVDFYTLIQACQANIDKVKSAKTIVSWTGWGSSIYPVQNTDKENPATITVSMIFDGKKRRQEKAECKNWTRGDETKQYIVDDNFCYVLNEDISSSEKNLYIQRRENILMDRNNGGSSAFLGGPDAHYQRLQQPFMMIIEPIEQYIKAAIKLNWDIQRGDNEIFIARSRYGEKNKKNKGIGVILSFDSHKGYGITKEQYFIGANNQLFTEINRTFYEDDGIWILKEVTFDRYRYDENTKTNNLTTQIKTDIKLSDLNKPIPESVFSPTTLDLPDSYLVVNRDTKDFFRVRSKEKLDLSLNQLFERYSTAPIKNDQTSTATSPIEQLNRSIEIDSPKILLEPASQKINTDSMKTEYGRKDIITVTAFSLGVVLTIIALILSFRSFKKRNV